MSTAHLRTLARVLLASIVVLAAYQLGEQRHRVKTQLGISPGVISLVAAAGRSATQTITVTNRGAAPVRIVNIELLTDLDDLDAAENCTTAPLSPGDSCDLQLEYAPSSPTDRATSKIRMTVAGGATKDLDVTTEARAGNRTSPAQDEEIWI